jgi:hypothetical protein
MVAAGAPCTPLDPWWVRDNLCEAIDRLVALGYTARGGQAQGEDPELIDPGGSAVVTWREDYPYRERMSREEYEAGKYRLEPLKFQCWAQDQEFRHVIVSRAGMPLARAERSSLHRACTRCAGASARRPGKRA